jgi:transcriptional regulator of heat shock response
MKEKTSRGRAPTDKIFWAHIYKLNNLSKKIEAMSRRQLDEKTLTIAFKKMCELTQRMETALERLEKLVGSELFVEVVD